MLVLVRVNMYQLLCHLFVILSHVSVPFSSVCYPSHVSAPLTSVCYPSHCEGSHVSASFHLFVILHVCP